MFIYLLKLYLFVYEKMDSFLLASQFTCYHSNPTIYIQPHGADLLILVIYVDDLIITSSSSSMKQSVKQALREQFEMTDVGLLHSFLALQVVQSSNGITILQQKFALDMLQRFNMFDCNLAPTNFHLGIVLSTTCTTPLVDCTLYRQVVVSLLYLTHTHPNISFAVGLVSKFSHDPHESHWQDSKYNLIQLRSQVTRLTITIMLEYIYFSRVSSDTIKSLLQNINI